MPGMPPSRSCRTKEEDRHVSCRQPKSPKQNNSASKTLQIINDAALALMMSIGHRTRSLRYDGRPAAVDGGGPSLRPPRLNERYVREWLGAMVTGGIVEYDPASGHLPPSARARGCLTRASSPNNVAVTSQWIAVLGGAEDAVVEAFRHGRGVPYSAYPRFHAVMAEESRQTVVDGLLNHILPLSRGLDRQARRRDRRARHRVRQRRRRHLDGRDVSAEPLHRRRPLGRGDCRRARRSGSARPAQHPLVQADAAELWLEDTYHLITAFDAIHDQARPARVLERVYAALRPGGVFLMQDIAGHTKLADNARHVARAVHLHDLVHALHVGVAGGRRPGAGRDVGPREGARDARRPPDSPTCAWPSCRTIRSTTTTSRESLLTAVQQVQGVHEVQEFRGFS